MLTDPAQVSPGRGLARSDGGNTVGVGAVLDTGDEAVEAVVGDLGGVVDAWVGRVAGGAGTRRRRSRDVGERGATAATGGRGRGLGVVRATAGAGRVHGHEDVAGDGQLACDGARGAGSRAGGGW